MKKIIIKELHQKFSTAETITRGDLKRFFQEYEPNLNDSTFGWSIYDLKRKNIISQVKKSTYVFPRVSEYSPLVSSKAALQWKKYYKSYPEIKACIWETGWLNEFTRHQYTKNIIIIETEKYFAESVFNSMNDQTSLLVFLNPDVKTLNLYGTSESDIVVVQPMISRSPVKTIHVNNNIVSVPTIEKILVDVYCNGSLLNYLGITEVESIFDSVLRESSINYSSLLNYAARRGKKEMIKQYLSENWQSLIKIKLND